MNLLESDTFEYLVKIISGFSMHELNPTQENMVCQAVYLYLQRNSSVDEKEVFNQLEGLITRAQDTLLRQARPSNPQKELFDILKQISSEYEGGGVSQEYLIHWCVVDSYLEIDGRKFVIEYSGRVHNTFSGEDNVAARRKAEYLKREGYEVFTIRHEDFDELKTHKEKYEYLMGVLNLAPCQAHQVKRPRPTF